VNEVETRSIRARCFAGVELHEAVVDLQSGQCGHDVFDQLDCRGSVRDRRAALSRDDVCECRGDRLGSRQIDTLEADARSFVGRKKTKRDISPRQEAKAVVFGRTRDGTLKSRVQRPSSVSPLLDGALKDVGYASRLPVTHLKTGEPIAAPMCRSRRYERNRLCEDAADPGK
jgi:hypothetical protein